MRATALDRLEKAAELSGLAFYGLLLIAAAAALSDAPGWGFLFLLAAGAAHVGRASFEEFVEVRPARERASERRTASARPRREGRPSASRQPADEFVVTATRSRRAAKVGR